MIFDRKDAHHHSSSHREELLRSELCGCFFCLSNFPPNKIDEWIDEGATALCPVCGIDSVIGSESGYEITAGFLEEMERYWFGMREKKK